MSTSVFPDTTCGAVAALPGPDLNDFEQRGAHVHGAMATAMAEIERRWGVKNPVLLRAAELPWHMFYGTGDSVGARGPVQGLTVMAKTKDGRTAFFMGKLLCPVVDADLALVGVMLLDEVNYVFAD